MPISEVDHIQKNDTKTVIYMEVVDQDEQAVDISAATTLEMYFLQPVSNTIDIHTATIENGPLGIMKYQLVLGDVDESGLIEAQGWIDCPTFTGFTERTTFYVDPNIVDFFYGSITAFLEGQ
jgi:hypothetical protein